MPDNSISYCSSGEDVKLLHVFSKTGTDTGFYVDIGANDGITGSNSYLLEQKGWNGLLIEPNPELHPTLLEKRSGRLISYLITDRSDEVEFNKVEGPENLHGLSRIGGDERFFKHVKAHGGEVKKIKVPCKPLTEILDENQVKSDFELLSIDVEGHELQVLRTLDFTRYNPRIILLEDNTKGKNKEPHLFLKQAGYQRVARTGVNDWYTKTLQSHFLIDRLKAGYTHWRWDCKRQLYRLLGKEFESGLI